MKLSAQSRKQKNPAHVLERSAIITILFIFFISLGTENAKAADQIYNKEHKSGEGFTIGEVPFTLTVDDNENKIFLVTSEGFVSRSNTLFIVNNTCQPIANILVCFNGTKRDIENDELKAKIIAYNYIPKITVARAVNTTKLVVGERTRVDVLINNTGSFSAINFTYIESFEDADIKDCVSCKINGTSIYYLNPALGVGENVKLSYEVLFESDKPKSLVGVSRYFDGVNYAEQFSDKTLFQPESFLEINMTINQSEVMSGETKTLKVTIRNKINRIVSIKEAELVVPEGIYVKSSGFSSKNNRLIISDLTLGGNTTKEIKSELQGRLHGGYDMELITSGEYTESSVKRTFKLSNRKKLIVKTEEVEIKNTLEEGESLESGQSKSLRITVLNHNQVGLNNVTATIHTNLTNEVPEFYSIGTISKSTSKILFGGNISIPVLNKSDSFPIVTRIFYTTDFGEKMISEHKRVVSVKPIEALKLYASLNQSTVSAGESTIMEVAVENGKRTTADDVEVFDILPEELKTVGTGRKTASINPLTKVTVYNYKINVPFVNESKIFSINTSAIYFDNVTKERKELSKITTINAIPKKLDIKVKRQGANVSTENLYKGRLISVDYELENNAQEIVRDLYLEFPESENIDVYGESTKKAASVISPGEKITLSDTEMFRIKHNGTVKIPGAVLHYKDSKGNELYTKADDVSATVNYGNIIGPAIIINKSAIVEENTLQAAEEKEFKNKVTVKLVVSNIGSEEAKAKVEDHYFESSDKSNGWSLIIGPGASSELEYSYMESRNGSFQLPRAKAQYENYIAFSNSAEITISSKEVDETVNEEEEKQKDIKGESTNDNETQKKKGFFQRISDFVKKVLFWKRSG